MFDKGFAGIDRRAKPPYKRLSLSPGRRPYDRILAADLALDTQRRTMVDRQIRTFDVTEHALIARFLDVPREKFLPKALAPFAYSDMTLKIPGEGKDEPRVMLSPAVLARLIQAAAVLPGEKVLDVAAATGYSSAILAGLAAEVVSLNRAKRAPASSTPISPRSASPMPAPSLARSPAAFRPKGLSM